MAHELSKARANAPLMQSQPQPPTLQLVLALGAMALKRGAEPNTKALEIYAESLVRSFNLSDCLAVIEEISETPQGFEKAFPDYGTLKMLIEERSHPLRHLRGIVRKLAENFGEKVTPTMIENFQTQLGHRTNEDLDAAFRTIMRSELKRMPTTGQFLSACPTLKVDRNGKKY